MSSQPKNNVTPFRYSNAAPSTASTVFTSSPDNRLQIGGGGGTMDGMNERVIRLEERTDLFGKQLDRIMARLDSMDEKLSTLPSKDFLLSSILTSIGVMLAIAIAFGLGTFAIADYAAKKVEPAQQIPIASQTQQPTIIVVPSFPQNAPVSANPAPPVAPTVPKQ
jgi:hypothetical protein